METDPDYIDSLSIAGDPDIRSRVISDFQTVLGNYSGPFCLPSGSSRIGTVFWDAGQVTQRLGSYFSDTL